MRRSGLVVPWVGLLIEAMHAGVISPDQKIAVPDEIEDQVEDAEMLSLDDEADLLELSSVPEKLQQVKAIAIKQIAKQSTDGRRTAQDIQAVNDFFDNGISMLQGMFPDTLDRGPERGDIPESVDDFSRSIHGLPKQQRPGAVQGFVNSIHRMPVITRDEARRESMREKLRESKILATQSRNWKPSADAKEFASRLRRG